MRTLVPFTLPLLFACAAHAGEERLSAALNESVFKLPATGAVTGQMTVTQYKPDGPGPFPIAILMHGRGAHSEDRAAMGRVRYETAAAYLVRRGFAVWLPTRLGYGDSGVTSDPEDSGTCKLKNYPPAYEASAQSALDVIAYASKQSFADPSRIVVIGQSFGGTTAIALAAKHPPGLLGTVNFAGGGGGNPETHPGQPCRPDRLASMFAGYGATARIPTMWIYTANDRWMGASYPQQWFAAYAKAGGTGQFAAMPAFGDDGHTLFSKGFPVWRPIVDKFLADVGFAMPVSQDAPPATSFAMLADVDKVPVTSTEAHEKYQRFLQLDVPRAYAIGPRGEFGYYSAPDAIRHAMASCAKRAGVPCKLYAVDDQVVWKE
jgi:dienelactone hydrolase